MIQKNLYLILILFVFFCTEIEEENTDKNPIEFASSLPSISEKVLIDSSKLIKAFDDIYFGSKSVIDHNREYSLANLNFKIKGYLSNGEFGLHTFTLESEPLYDFVTSKNIIEDIKVIISKKYSNIKKFKLQKEPTDYSEFKKMFGLSKNPAPPGDNFTNKFYEFTDKDTKIVISTTTFYKINDKNSIEKYQKIFYITLSFSNIKVEETMEKRYNDKLKQENENHKNILKNDANKF